MKRRIDTDLFGLKPKSINSKAKGNANERDAAKSMSLWSKKIFRRTPGSGAFSHTWMDKGKVTGDIISDTPGYDCYFSIEVKHLKEILYTDVLRKNSMIYKIWEQASADAKRIGKLPMAMLRPNGLKKFTAKDGNKYQDYIIVLHKKYGGKAINSLISIVFEGNDLMGFKLSEIYKRIDYTKFETLLRSKNLAEKYCKIAL